MRWITIFLLAANLVTGFWLSHSRAERLERLERTERTPTSAEQPQSDVPSLILVSELSTIERQTMADPPGAGFESRPAPVSPNQSGELCSFLGPFAEQGVADSLLERLIKNGADARIESDEVAAAADYWVHIPPQPSQRAASRLLQELQSKGLDSFIFLDGELKGGISLGVFAKRENARRHRRNIRDLGYDARIRTIHHTSHRYWVATPVKEYEKIAGNGAKSGVSTYLSTEVQQKPCESVASIGEFQ